MKAYIHRLQQDDKQTLGRFYLFDGINEVFSCATLELPDRGNQRFVSRICSGIYNVVPRHTDKYGNHFHILDVPERDFILIHYGNYHSNIEGCILFGRNFTDLNADGYLDVTESRATLDRLLALAPNGFELIIDDWLL